MYLSSVSLSNWRSYRDAKFRFKAPTRKKPLVLIGAMNGHGKTSFLLGLYLGLFGRFALRHAEGFSQFDGENINFYRQAIAKFRRRTAEPDEPTSIELVFSPTETERASGESDIRIVRRWFFSGAGRPRQNGFEEVQLYVDNRLQRLADIDAAQERLERRLFPASFMAAFFFDGEQAQTLINQAGERGIKKAVEVLFGTKILEDVGGDVKQFIVNARGKVGGTRRIGSQERELNQKVNLRSEMEAHIRDLKEQMEGIEKKRVQFETEQKELREKLARLGGADKAKLEELQTNLERARREVLEAEDAVTKDALAIGPALALARLAPAILNRLESERLREQWENLKEGTLSRTDEVLGIAIPEPPENDDLLGQLSTEVRTKVKERFRFALQQIYHPPPEGYAEEYRLGHVKGELRQRLKEMIRQISGVNSAAVREDAVRLKQAREKAQDLEAQRARFSDLPREVQELADKLNDIGSEISECSRQLGSFEREIKAKEAELKTLNADIGRLQEQLASIGPEQRRIAIAERVQRSIDEIIERLRPVSLMRLKETVTEHFASIADKRFRGGRIEFADGTEPVLKLDQNRSYLIETMSGFERRSFGVAFSLALAEITKRRIPLVIDTPLGNADTEYRPRLLEALTEVDLDQIIVLTHDAEVNGSLFDHVKGHVQQTFLVEFDVSKNESVVYPDVYFGDETR